MSPRRRPAFRRRKNRSYSRGAENFVAGHRGGIRIGRFRIVLTVVFQAGAGIASSLGDASVAGFAVGVLASATIHRRCGRLESLRQCGDTSRRGP